MSLSGATDLDKLHELCKQTHKDQAVWFLNAFWGEFINEQEAEKIWNFVDQAHRIDNAKEAGTALDEMEAHRFLEKADEAHTVLEMRSQLRKTGAIGQSERPKTVPLSHYFLFKYDAHSKTLFHDLVTRSQGDNSAAIAEAQAKLDAVSAAFEEAARAAEAAAASLKDAQQREADAEESAKQLAIKEEEMKASQLELEAALAEVKKQEDAYNAKTETLKKKSEEGGVVSRNKAKNELAQHLAEDPLPLRQAKITAEAAVRKAEKAVKAAAEAKEQAQKDAVAAGEARAQAEKDKEAADAAVDAAQAAVAEAEEFLAKEKAKPGCAQGALWWIDRELHEKKKYMPMRKGGIAK